MWTSNEGEFRLNKKQYEVPLSMIWHERTWQLRSAILFVSHGHYVSLVRSEDGWMKFDDDNVEQIRDRSVSSALRRNTYGYVYGLIYERSM